MGGGPRLVRAIKAQWCTQGPHSAVCNLSKDTSENLTQPGHTINVTKKDEALLLHDFSYILLMSKEGPHQCLKALQKI